MLVNFLRKHRLTRSLVFAMGRNRGRAFASYVKPYLNAKDKIIDIGTGTGHVCLELQRAGYMIRPLDVVNLSFSEEIAPELYDGSTIPYPDKYFDTALLLTVLHHVAEPEVILCEAKRVAKQVIVIEDIYTSLLHKYLTFGWDSLLNLEFRGHPHTNKTDSEWKLVFATMGMKLKDAKYIKTCFCINQSVYVLKT